jgi:hypothetical protein
LADIARQWRMVPNRSVLLVIALASRPI